MGTFGCSLYFPSNGSFWFRFSENMYECLKFSLTGWTGFLFVDRCDAQHGIFLFLAIIIWFVTSQFSFRATYGGIRFGGTETLNVVQSDR